MQRTLSRKLTGATAGLTSGDCLSQSEFHDLSERVPTRFKTELIGGTVYIGSSPSDEHETAHRWLSGILMAYQMSSVGLELRPNAKLILDDNSEPQPDLLLRRLPSFGGLSSSRLDGYIQGPPELIVEIADSRRSIDFHAKQNDYARCGVPEYLVYTLDEKRLHWFDLRAGRALRPDADGIFRMRQFPGLWIDAAAVTANDRGKMITVLQHGISTPKYNTFMRSLRAKLQPAQGLPQAMPIHR